MKYHILTGDVRMQVEAPTLEKAFSEVLRRSQLDRCSVLICGFEHGKKFTDDDTRWGLTEWYLKDAGYRQIGEHQWRAPVTNVESSGKRGSTQKKEKVVSTSQPSPPPVNISKTDSTAPSIQDTKPQARQSSTKNHSAGSAQQRTKRSSRKRMMAAIKKVALQRTPEEWKAVLEEARLNSGKPMPS